MLPTKRRIRLKAATDSLHRRIDGQISRGSAFASLSGYRDYLSRTLTARREVEDLLDRSQAQRIYTAWPRRRITDVLTQDLEDLGAPEVKAQQPARAPLGEGGVFGALYVLEGASIGARLIARKVEHLGAHGRLGARHLVAQTSEPDAFRKFLELLEAAEMQGDQEAECLSAAVFAFECFDRSYAGLA